MQTVWRVSQAMKNNWPKYSPPIVKNEKGQVVNTIKLSFLSGPKVEVNGAKKASYAVNFIDADSGSNIFATEIGTNHWCGSLLKYYVNWNVLVYENNKKLIDYKFDLAGHRVFISIASAALGDTLAWIPYIDEFKRVRNCEVHVVTHKNSLIESCYPNLKFLPLGSDFTRDGDYHAAYHIGTFDNDYNKNKNNWRLIPLQQAASDMLGLKYKEIKPRVAFDPNTPRPIENKYVAISEFSTFQGKLWNYIGGWQTIVDWLISQGYDVMSVSKEPTQLKNVIKKNNTPVEEAINDIRHSEFYIGGSSGLAWLAWALDVKTVIISGFTEPYTEMTDCVRIINTNVCHGCYNDQHAQQFDRGNWRWCPRNNNFDCTTKITPDMVKQAITGAKLLDGERARRGSRPSPVVPVEQSPVEQAPSLLERNSSMPQDDHRQFHPRVWKKDGWIVDLGCEGWDWVSPFIGKKKILGADPFETSVPNDSMKLFRGFVGTINGQATFNRNDKEPPNATSIHTKMLGNDFMELISLDGLLAKYNVDQVDILKMNIEGMEYDLLINLDQPIADQIIVAFHGSGSKTEAIKMHLSQWYTCQQTDAKWNWWLFLRKDKQKIRLVHLLNFPEQEVEINSVASLRQLEEYGVEYVQHYNPITMQLPEAPALRPTNVWGGPLKPGYYGCWAAFRRAVEEEFTEDVDWFMICERDCVLEVTAEEFYRKMQSYLPHILENNIAYFSFGERINPKTGYEESKVKERINNEMFITPQIINDHCVIFPRSSREFLLDSYKNVPWYAMDLWFNEVFEKAGMPIAIVQDRLASQHGGVSLIDRPEDNTPYDNDIPGFMLNGELDWLHHEAKKMTSIAELGSFRGKSTAAFCSACPGTVYAVDKFSDEGFGFYPDGGKPERPMLEDFKSNVGHFENLKIIQMDTVEAAKHIPDVDMVFIDTTHEYEQTLAELKAWAPKAKKLICGHDWNPNLFPGVEKAVVEYLGYTPAIVQSIWFAYTPLNSVYETNKLHIVQPVSTYQPKVLMIMDHCSTGGMPQYVLRCVEQLKRSGTEVRVVEANFVSEEYQVQRKKLQQMVPFYSLNGNKATDIRRILEEYKPDIVHIQEFPERWAFSEPAIELVKEIYRAGHPYKIIETSHGSNFEPEQKRYFPDVFAFVSKYHANKFACFNIPYEIVEYTVEPHKRPDRTEALGKLGLDPVQKHILNVGLFTPGKNQAEAFELARRLPDLQFHFVGNQAPNFADYWEPLLKNKPDNCILWGERADVDAFYSAMDLFLFTSKFELNPLVVKEALSWGMPVLMRALPTYDGFPNGAAVIDDDIDKTCKMLDGIFPSMARRLNRIYTRHV
jgi:autotransporter strand-loop-strand O-heptosyltransferase